MNAVKENQASDNKIQQDILTEVWNLAAEQRRRPFCIMVGGDGGYGQILQELQRHGAGFQFWLLSTQDLRPYVKNLDPNHKMFLDEILELDKFQWFAEEEQEELEEY